MCRHRMTAQDFFSSEEPMDGAELTGEELVAAFWLYKKIHRDFEQQLLFWRSTNDSLSDAYDKLAAYEERVGEQQRTIRALTAPIIRVWHRILVMPLIGRFTNDLASNMTDELLHAAREDASAFVILDLTGAHDTDAETVTSLVRIRQALGLLGTRCLLSGMSSGVARALIASGLEGVGLQCFATLHVALRHALGRIDSRSFAQLRGRR